MNTPDVPFGRSYWVIPGKLLAGFYPGHHEPGEETEKLRALLAAGIRHCINLVEENEVNHTGLPFVTYETRLHELAKEIGAEVTCTRLSIRDMDVPAREHMCTILDTIDQAINEGRSVYVHCWGGIGRTGTVVGCYLARRGMAVGDEVLPAIQALRRHEQLADRISPETARQRDMIRSWQAGE